MAIAGQPWEYDTVESEDLLSNGVLEQKSRNNWELVGFAFNPGEPFQESLFFFPGFYRW